jgi:hypothetical protein
MKHFLLLLLLCWVFIPSFSQTDKNPGVKGLKGSGEVFYTETFGWANPADPKGWTAPPGYYLLDPDDNGFNWHWWPYVGMVADYTDEPPLESTTKLNGSLNLFMNQYNDGIPLGEKPRVNNSIVFPAIDCSSRSSVVVRYETSFMCYDVGWNMWLEVSVDNWVHSAVYDVGYRCGHKDRPNDTSPGKPVIYEANITDVAAGQSNVQFKFTWKGTSMYWWQIDDFQVAEAWDYDLKLKHVKMEWDDENPDTHMSWFYSIPKSQLNGTRGFMNFQSSTLNFGEMDQEDVFLDLDISKNGNSVFHKTTTPKYIPTLVVDTANIADKYSPQEFGHYKIAFDFKSDNQDNLPLDNKQEILFNVSDSVYSRADNSSELAWGLGYEHYILDGASEEGHYAASIFPIFADCEVSSVSVFIAGGKADELLTFRYAMYYVPLGEEDQTPVERLTTEIVQLDSSMLGKWITLPFEKDGESEFLKPGDLVYAGVMYWNMNPSWVVRRNKGLKIGTDNSVKLTEPVAVSLTYDGWETGLADFTGKRNLMIHLNLNDHSNIRDGVDVSMTAGKLEQNFPNPFRSTTDISYELAAGSDVRIEVMDLAGRQVMEIKEGTKPAGKHTCRLDGSLLEPGIYFYTLKAGNYIETKRMAVQ